MLCMIQRQDERGFGAVRGRKVETAHCPRVGADGQWYSHTATCHKEERREKSVSPVPQGTQQWSSDVLLLLHGTWQKALRVMSVLGGEQEEDVPRGAGLAGNRSGLGCGPCAEVSRQPPAVTSPRQAPCAPLTGTILFTRGCSHSLHVSVLLYTSPDLENKHLFFCCRPKPP